MHSDGLALKVLADIEYRAVSGVLRTIDTPPPLHPASVSSLCTKRGGGYTCRAVRGWGVNILEDARHWIGLFKYNPSSGFMMKGILLWVLQSLLFLAVRSVLYEGPEENQEISPCVSNEVVGIKCL